VLEEDQYRTADAMMSLLGLLEGCYAPEERGLVDTLGHSLQAATRAERAGAGADLVAAALCHDVGKVFSLRLHDQIAASLVSGYLPPDLVRVVRHHAQVTAIVWDRAHVGLAARYHRAPWYPEAVRFVSEWDVPAFDPDYPTEPLCHFEPLLRDVFARQRWPDPRRLPARLEPLRGAIDAARRLVGRG
jgi:predicted HD phosphohydrolase